MKANPCRYCLKSFDNNARHIPSFATECMHCKYREEHEKYLQSKRMYIPGEQIFSESQLNKCTYVFWNGKPTHIEVIRSLQYRIILRFLRERRLREAVKREDA